jgi:hypothetical protein
LATSESSRGSQTAGAQPTPNTSSRSVVRSLGQFGDSVGEVSAPRQAIQAERADSRRETLREALSGHPTAQRQKAQIEQRRGGLGFIDLTIALFATIQADPP